MPADNPGGHSNSEPSMGQLLQFVERYADTPSKFQLLFFLARHPNASFDFLSFASALWVKQYELREALSALVSSALVEQTDANGVTLYRLGHNPRKRASVLALAELTWEQAQKLSQFCARHHLGVTPQFCKIAAPVK